MAVYGKKAQIERYGVSGVKGYKKERASIEEGMAAEFKKDPEKAKKYVDAEMDFRMKQDSIEDHIENIKKRQKNGR